MDVGGSEDEGLLGGNDICCDSAGRPTGTGGGPEDCINNSSSILFSCSEFGQSDSG